jgi:ABC-type multidrug transport system fused ATPase/permease subunit
VIAAVGGVLPGPPTSGLALLLVLCVSIVVLRALHGVLNMLSTTLLVSAGLHMVFRLRCALFDHVQRLSLRFHDTTTVGDSLYRVTWDTYSAQALFNTGIVPAVTAGLTLAGISVMMLSQDVMVTAAALAVSVPIALLVRRLDRPMTQHSLRVHERESDVSTRVQETLVGIRAVQAFGQEELEGARFRRQAEASLRANLGLTVLQMGSQALIGVLIAAGTGAVVWIAVSQARKGRITVGDVVLLLAYLAMLYKPLETLAYTAAAVQGAAAGAARVLTVLDATPDVTDTAGALDLGARARGRVVFEDVAFRYAGEEAVLRDVSLDVEPGETVAVVGASGAGKTTIASLLLRFYDPTGGRILLDDHDLRTLALRSLRRNVSLVLQEPVIFGTTVGENIAYGRPGAGAVEIQAAARAAGAADFIETLPDGYETRLGERGVSLSGGQRQRLSLARAFLKDAPVLILDEPTSALDPETEHRLVETLRQLTRRCTTLIIAHRLSTIRHADRIVVLRDGTIAEMGSHAALLARGDVYARWYAMQSGLSVGVAAGIEAGRPARVP